MSSWRNRPSPCRCRMPCNPDPANVTQATKEVHTRWKLFKEQQRRAHRYAAAEGSDNAEKAATESDARDEDPARKRVL